MKITILLKRIINLVTEFVRITLKVLANYLHN